MTFRFLHLADLHLDSAYGGRPPLVQRLRRATVEALTAGVDVAIDAGLDAVLIAGDAFDDDRLGYDARAAFRREMRRLGDAGVTVVYVTGNHDPGAPTRRAAGLSLDHAGDAQRAPFHSVLSPEPVAIEIHGRDGEAVGVVIAAGHGSSRVTDNLAARFSRSLVPASHASLPCAGLLHTQVTSARGADGHEPYAPSTLADLLAAELDYWALGHVHVRGQVDPAVPAFYAGNLQGRNARESGPKGALIVELDSHGLINEPEFVALAPAEFFRCRVTVDPQTEPERLARAITDALDESVSHGTAPNAAEVVVRVDLDGEPPGDVEAWESAALDELRHVSAPGYPEFLEVQSGRIPAGAEEGLPSGEIEDWLAELEASPSALREALRACAELEADPSLAEAFGATLASRPTDEDRDALFSGLKDELVRRLGRRSQRP